MRDGVIVVDGPPEQVMRSAVLAEVFGMQIPVHEVDGLRLALHWGPAVSMTPAQVVPGP